MIRFYVTSFALMLAVSFSSAYAETYSWSDEQGTVHFTEDLGKVPQNIRNKVKRENETGYSLEEEEPSAAKAPSAKTPETTSQVVPSGGSESNGTYGKEYDRVQKDLSNRDAAMTAVRKRIDEIAAKLNGYSGSWEEQNKLLQEHKSLRAKFKDMKSEYFQQVEAARKAGFQVNIEE